MAFENMLSPILNPLLNLNPLLVISIISFTLTLIITIIYKYVTDQKKMKQLKDDMKEQQQEMKKYRENPKKMMEIQKKAMEKNMEYMMHSFRPMIITLLPILIVFGWLNAHMAYEPILPNQDFTTTAVFAKGVTGNVILVAPKEVEIVGNAAQEIKEEKKNSIAEWTLKGAKGEFLLEYQYKDKSFTRTVFIDEKEYKSPVANIKDSELKSLKVNNKSMTVINIFGLKLNWLWSYIILSIILSAVLRKLLKIY